MFPRLMSKSNAGLLRKMENKHLKLWREDSTKNSISILDCGKCLDLEDVCISANRAFLFSTFKLIRAYHICHWKLNYLWMTADFILMIIQTMFIAYSILISCLIEWNFVFEVLCQNVLCCGSQETGHLCYQTSDTLSTTIKSIINH